MVVKIFIKKNNPQREIKSEYSIAWKLILPPSFVYKILYNPYFLNNNQSLLRKLELKIQEHKQKTLINNCNCFLKITLWRTIGITKSNAYCSIFKLFFSENPVQMHKECLT